MKFPGHILPKKKGEKFYSVEIPLLGIHTQGKTYKDCLAMAKDALESLLNIDVEVEPWGNAKDTFVVSSNQLKPLIARFLATRRAAAGFTMAEVAKRLGGSWVNNYAQYEKGKSLPGIEQLQKLIAAIPSKEVDKILVG